MSEQQFSTILSFTLPPKNKKTNAKEIHFAPQDLMFSPNLENSEHYCILLGVLVFLCIEYSYSNGFVGLFYSRDDEEGRNLCTVEAEP